MKKANIFKHAQLLLMAICMGFAFSSCSEDDGPLLSSEAEIKTFSFAGLNPAVEATISGTNITASVPYNVNVTALTPTITLSDKASVAPASEVPRDFTQPVTYTVTAENGTTKAYTVTVTKQPQPTMTVTPIWQRTIANGGLPNWFTANNDRDLAAAGNFVYVHNNNDRIRVLNATTGADVAVGASGTFIDGKQNFASGNLFLLGLGTDTQGRIVGSNLRVGDAAMNNWNVYVWNNKDAAQELLFQYPTPAGNRLGENLAVVGDVRGNGAIYAPTSGFGTASNRILKFNITGGTVNTTPQTITLAGLTNTGNAPDVAPVSNAANANIIVAGTGVGGIAEYTSAGALVGKLPDNLKDDPATTTVVENPETAMLSLFALDVAAFELNGRKIVATTATDFTSNAADAGYLYLIDYTDGWANVKKENIKRVAFTPAGNIDKNLNGTGGVAVSVTGNTAIVYALITNFGVGAYRVTF